MRGIGTYGKLMPYMEERSEAVLRLLEGGKRRGLEELKKGRGGGNQKQLFQTVAASQKAFLELHDRCRTALRAGRTEDARDIVVDIQYLLYLFSRQVYDIAFAGNIENASVSFPPPEAYSRHYPGQGPQDEEGQMLFTASFGETVYSPEKSTPSFHNDLDHARKGRLEQTYQFLRSA